MFRLLVLAFSLPCLFPLVCLFSEIRVPFCHLDLLSSQKPKMPVLGKTIISRSCAIEQASRQVLQLFRRYNNTETSHVSEKRVTRKTKRASRLQSAYSTNSLCQPHTCDPAAYHTSTPPIQLLPEKITYTPSSPPTPTDPAPRLSPAAKVGIITACIVIFILLFLLTFELAYLRRQRRARAVQQVQCEVDQEVVELDDVKSGREVKENVVLESRVEIVVGEEEEAQEVV